MSFLHPALQDPDNIAAIRQAWDNNPRLRIGPVLADGVPETLLEALRQQTFQLQATHLGEFNHLYWVNPIRPQDGDTLLHRFAAWLRQDLCQLVADISGRALAPTSTGQVISTLYGYGCYLDIHNDGGDGRSVAFVLGLTPEAWPASEGGHLEFIDAQGEIVEQRPPGWNTLDLFDVAQQAPLHRIPMLTAHRERRVFSGWFYNPHAAGAESDSTPA